MMNVTKNQKGFTLIELIVVIVIIGILAAIAVPKYMDLTTEAQTAADKANAKAVEAAIMSYFAKQVVANNSYLLSAAVTYYNTAAGATLFADGIKPAGITVTCPAEVLTITY